MKIRKPVVDYTKLRPSNLFTNEYRHLLLLLYWLVFIPFFTFEERLFKLTYHPVGCFLDGLIPFCEWFLIPYLFWFAFIVLALVYTGLYDIDAFSRMMKFIMLTYTVTLICYLIYPTCQLLRPTGFARNNILTRFIAGFYDFDTNTNVCPSIHVIGSLATAFGLMKTRLCKSGGMKLAVIAVTLLIVLSTLFIKQHSVIDVLCALPICAAGYFLCFFFPKRKTVQKEKSELLLSKR